MDEWELTQVAIDGIDVTIGGKEALAAEMLLLPNERDARESLLKKWAVRHNSEGKWGLVTSDIYGLAELSRRERKYEESLHLYLEALYLELNGPMNHGVFDKQAHYVNTYYTAIAKMIVKSIGKTADEMEIMFLDIAQKSQGKFRAKLPYTPQQGWTKLKAQVCGRQLSGKAGIGR